VLDAAVDGYRCIVVRAPVNERSSGHELSPREQEIARMVAQGHTNKTIARVLDISIWTVSSHLRRAFSKADVTSRAALVAKLAKERDPLATARHRDARPPAVDAAVPPASLRHERRIS
jgi:DNA-binding CsgD family transcriptional regulator